MIASAILQKYYANESKTVVEEVDGHLSPPRVIAGNVGGESVNVIAKVAI